jgi:hypothetical protein
MTDLLKLILGVLASLFKSRAKLEAEILILPATDQCASPAGTEATASQHYRSFSVCLALSLVPLRPGRHCDCQANPRRLTPSLYTDLISDRHTVI